MSVPPSNGVFDFIFDIMFKLLLLLIGGYILIYLW